MNDDEVNGWLDGAEQDRAESGPDARALARALAETRKALAACEWAAQDDLKYMKCPVCGGYQFGNGNGIGGHFVRCIFTTMPRPKT